MMSCIHITECQTVVSNRVERNKDLCKKKRFKEVLEKGIKLNN